MCVKKGRSIEATKLIRAQRRVAYLTLIRPVSLADAELALCYKGVRVLQWQ